MRKRLPTQWLFDNAPKKRVPKGAAILLRLLRVQNQSDE